MDAAKRIRNCWILRSRRLSLACASLAVAEGRRGERLTQAPAFEPKAALLLDDPFGAPDANARKELRRRFGDVHDATGLTMIFATDDEAGAIEAAGRIAIVIRRAIEQTGTRGEIAGYPAAPSVTAFSR